MGGAGCCDPLVMDVRDAVPALDAAGCLSIYAPFVRETAVSFEEVVPSLEEFASRIEAVQRTHPWLILDTGEGVGAYAYASQHRARAAYRWAAAVTVYVAPGSRCPTTPRWGCRASRLWAERGQRLRRSLIRISSVRSAGSGSIRWSA